MADIDNTRLGAALLKSSNAKWAADAPADNIQTPHSLWIGCSDSRVPESVTGSKPGDIFVQRNIANQFPCDDNNVLSVLAYAVDSLKIKDVIIVGHSHCGGAAASLKAAQNPKFVPRIPIITIDGEPANSPLNRWLEPLTLLAYSLRLPDNSKESLDILVRENIKAQVENLANTETIVKAWALMKPVFIHRWVYDLDTRLLEDLNISRPFGPIR